MFQTIVSNDLSWEMILYLLQTLDISETKGDISQACPLLN